MMQQRSKFITGVVNVSSSSTPFTNISNFKLQKQLSVEHEGTPAHSFTCTDQAMLEMEKILIIRTILSLSLCNNGENSKNKQAKKNPSRAMLLLNLN